MKQNKGVLFRVLNQCVKVVNEKQEGLTVLSERRIAEEEEERRRRRKAARIAADHSQSVTIPRTSSVRKTLQGTKRQNYTNETSFIPLSMLRHK